MLPSRASKLLIGTMSHFLRPFSMRDASCHRNLVTPVQDKWGLVVLDFDESITEQDTTFLIPLLASTVRPDDETYIKKEWEKLMEFYSSSSKRANANMQQIAMRKKGLEGLEDYLMELGGIDENIMERLSKSGILLGLSQERISAALKGPLRDKWSIREGATSAIKTAVTSCQCSCHILSASLSSEMLRAIIAEAIGDPSLSNKIIITANSILGDNQKDARGDVMIHVVGGHGKREILRELKKKTKGSVLYIGDSATDLLPLIDADCGVIIGDSQHIFEVAKAFHINVMPLLSSQKTPLEKAKREGSGGENLNLNLNSKRIERGTTSRTDNKPVIYHARNWREIQAKLLS